MSPDKLKRINDLIEEIQSEIDQPIWADDQKDGLRDAQGSLLDVQKSVQRTDYKFGTFNHVNPESHDC